MGSAWDLWPQHSAPGASPRVGDLECTPPGTEGKRRHQAGGHSPVSALPFGARLLESGAASGFTPPLGRGPTPAVDPSAGLSTLLPPARGSWWTLLWEPGQLLPRSLPHLRVPKQDGRCGNGSAGPRGGRGQGTAWVCFQDVLTDTGGTQGVRAKTQGRGLNPQRMGLLCRDRGCGWTLVLGTRVSGAQRGTG